MRISVVGVVSRPMEDAYRELVIRRLLSTKDFKDRNNEVKVCDSWVSSGFFNKFSQ